MFCLLKFCVIIDSFGEQQNQDEVYGSKQKGTTRVTYGCSETEHACVRVSGSKYGPVGTAT